jgi:hypothetical protein
MLCECEPRGVESREALVVVAKVIDLMATALERSVVASLCLCGRRDCPRCGPDEPLGGDAILVAELRRATSALERIATAIERSLHATPPR